MPNSKHGLRLDLRTLILVLCALTALVMLCASYFASYRVQRQLLIDHALEANRVYATKLASITETFISNAQQQLSFSAGVQARQLGDAQALQAETERVLSQSMAFNSTFVLDANGVLLAISPAPLRHLVGSRMHSPGVQEALQARSPLVSTPYMSAANNLVVALSHPILDSNGRYLGYVGVACTCVSATSSTACWANIFTRTVRTCTWSTATVACSITPMANGWAKWLKAMP